MNIRSPNNTFQSTLNFAVDGSTNGVTKIHYNDSLLPVRLSTTVNNVLTTFSTPNEIEFLKNVIINSPAKLKNNLSTVVATTNDEYITLYHLINSFILNGTNI
jgi:hypothetical protein